MINRALIILVLLAASAMAIKAGWRAWDVFLISLLGHPISSTILEIVEAGTLKLRFSFLSIFLSALAAIVWAPILFVISDI